MGDGGGRGRGRSKSKSKARGKEGRDNERHYGVSDGGSGGMRAGGVTGRVGGAERGCEGRGREREQRERRAFSVRSSV